MADKKQTENFVKSIDFTDLLPKMAGQDTED